MGSNRAFLVRVWVTLEVFTEHQPCGEHCVCLVAQLSPTLCDPMGCSPPGSSVYGDSPGKNTEVGCHALLQEIFPTQESNPGLSALQEDSLPSEPPAKPVVSTSLYLKRPGWWSISTLNLPCVTFLQLCTPGSWDSLNLPCCLRAISESLLLSFLLPSFPFLVTIHTSDFSVTAFYSRYVSQYLISNTPTAPWISHWSYLSHHWLLASWLLYPPACTALLMLNMEKKNRLCFSRWLTRWVRAKSLQSCLTLCDPIDCSLPGPLSMKFSRHEYWNGLPCPPQGIFLTQGSNPCLSQICIGRQVLYQ